MSEQDKPVAWLDCWGEPHKRREDAMQDADSVPDPLYTRPAPSVADLPALPERDVHIGGIELTMSNGEWAPVGHYVLHHAYSSKALRAAIAAACAARPVLTDEQIDAAIRAESDDLLDRVYEYGTSAEGVQARLRIIARAVLAATQGSKP